MTEQRLFAIDALNDLAAETDFVAAAVGAIGHSESTGLSLIIARWSDKLTEIAEDLSRIGQEGEQ